MGILEISFIGVGLAMDAFAVSVCKGLSMKKFSKKKMFIIALYFGFFQLLMPIIGYYLGINFEVIVKNVDHWIAFVLLGSIGFNMIKESFEYENTKIDDKIDFKTMVFLATATSIDALAVGITFAFYKVYIWNSVVLIGIITFVLSCIGLKIGFKFGDRFKNRAELVGGILLICIGLKILLEDLGIICKIF